MTLSVLLHGGLVALLVYGWWRLQHRSVSAPAQVVLDATVVDGRTLPPQSAPAAAAPEPSASGPAPASAPAEAAPSADDQAVPVPDATVREQAAQAQVAHDAAVQHEELMKTEQAAAQAEVEQKARAEAEMKSREAAAQAAKLDAARRAREQAEQVKQARAEARRKAGEQARAEAQQKAEAAQRQADAARQDDLQRSLDAEERVNAARASGAEAGWIQQITARIQHAWRRPPSAHGIDCHLELTQVPGGEITHVELGRCNADDATRQSIVNAAYLASPLPAPPDPALFVRELDVHFNPPD